MASSKVSSLTASDALAGTELFYADGLASAVAADVKVTSTQIKTWTSASPTLVTPVLGVATGTSIALGGATLGTNALAVNGQVTNAGGTLTASAPFTITQTWNNGAVTFEGLKVDITNTASNIGTSTVFSVGWGGTNYFSIIRTGNGTLLSLGDGSGHIGSASQRWNDAWFFVSVNLAADAAKLTLGNSQDTTLSRNAAGVFQFGTTAANAAGSLLATNGTFSGTVRTSTAYTVATLPVVGTAGRQAYVTDALTPAFGATVVGGGAVKIPVFDDGTNWIVG